MTRRTYYDHEPAYRRIAAAGGRGWDDLHGAPVTGSYDAFTRFFASAHGPAPGTRALDLGCGGGEVTLALAARGCDAVGVDFAETAIELARANAGGRARFVVGDCLALGGFADGTFDLAIDNHVLHCLLGDDRTRFLREAARVLVPGGLLFCSTMSREGDLDCAALGVDPATFVARNGNRYWTTAEQLDAELTRAGFAIEVREAHDPGPGEGRDLTRYARKVGSR